jgi:hypothetical protein
MILNYPVIEWRKSSYSEIVGKVKNTSDLRSLIKLNSGQLFVNFNGKRYISTVQIGEDCDYAFFTLKAEQVPEQAGIVEIEPPVASKNTILGIDAKEKNSKSESNAGSKGGSVSENNNCKHKKKGSVWIIALVMIVVILLLLCGNK